MTHHQGSPPYPGHLHPSGTAVHQLGPPAAAAGTTTLPFHPHPVPRPTDPVAIWALVLSFLVWPVGMGLGIAALVRHRRHGLDGHGLAVAAVVVAGVQLLLLPLLAAIAIPVFLNQRDKAVEMALRSDLRGVAVEMESVWVDTGAYPTTVPTTALSATTARVEIIRVDAQGYCLRAVQRDGDTVVYQDESRTFSTTGCP